MSEPTREYLRRGEVLEWLEGLGITRWDTRQMMEEGLLAGAPIRRKHGLRKYFQKSQIKKILGL